MPRLTQSLLQTVSQHLDVLVLGRIVEPEEDHVVVVGAVRGGIDGRERDPFFFGIILPARGVQVEHFLLRHEDGGCN